MNKHFEKVSKIVVTVVVTLAMLLNATAISFATTNLENGDIIVTPLSKTMLLFHERDSGKETVITMAESNDSIKVSLKEVGNNQETGFFVANKEKQVKSIPRIQVKQ